MVHAHCLTFCVHPYSVCAAFIDPFGAFEMVTDPSATLESGANARPQPQSEAECKGVWVKTILDGLILEWIFPQQLPVPLAHGDSLSADMSGGSCR